MSNKVIHLVAIGTPPQNYLKELEEPIRAQLGATIVSIPKPLPNPAYAFNKDRKQYHSNAIMRRLVPLLDAGQTLLGILDVDLFEPDSPFVFGQADRESRCALLSISRLRLGDGEPARRRIHIEGIHHAGHLVGLSFCEDTRCAMYLSQTLQDVDKKQPALCHVCRNELAKLSR